MGCIYKERGGVYTRRGMGFIQRDIICVVLIFMDLYLLLLSFLYDLVGI